MDKIRRFNDFCAQNYPSAEVLTEEIVLDYCKKKKRNPQSHAITEL